jgi:signal transduction histidine kinase
MIYLVFGLVTFLMVPFLALNWMKLPFIGAYVEQTMIINSIGPSGDPSAWTLNQQGVGFGNRLLAVDQMPVQNAFDLSQAIGQRAVGSTVTLSIRTPEGVVEDRSVPLTAFPTNDRLTFFYFPYGIGLIYLIAGVWVFAIRRHHPSGRAFALFAVSVALGIGLLFDVFTTHIFTPLWTIAIAMVGASAISMSFYFPREDPIIQRRPYLALIPSVIGILLALYAIFRLYDIANPTAYALGWRFEYIFIGLSILFVIGWFIARRRRITWPSDREQLRMMATAAILSFLPMGIWLILTVAGTRLSFTPYLLLPLLIFPVMAGYTVQRYRMMQADMILSQGMQYGLLSILIAVGYALVAAGLSLALGRGIAPNSPLFTGLIFFILALLLNPLRGWTQRMIDSLFFRGKRAYQDRLQTFSGDLTRIVDLPEILTTLRRYVQETLTPSRLHIFIYDPLADQYTAGVDATGNPTTDLRFSNNSGLVTRLAEQRSSLMLSEYDSLPSGLEADRNRLALLGAQAFIPLPGRQRLSGWLALGPRLSGEPYTSHQIGFTEALCDQAALAIERAQVVGNMENRVREMNVLTRVAQGINITLTLDDILELVYAQTVQILPSQIFRIMLYDRATDSYTYAFYLEHDDRVSDMEGHSIAAGQALEQEVVRQRRSIQTKEYVQECKRRNIIIHNQEIVYAWMGVPLNAGAETIGALSLGSMDPVVEYTPDQLALLQAIADQFAGALVKARLLEESERRARQLGKLNEVTRQLTSTLETEPLLQSILQSAVDILNCEAGSLLMVDEQTDELIFRSAVSPVKFEFVGVRIPAGSGVVGSAVKTRLPVIVNDVNKFPQWFNRTDEQTGFITRALLAIPLIVKDKVIGVVEVINKKDQTVFSKDDVDLLFAFASQAAVAIENARLYTLTDQALSARVEELSVMQRIDRELNTSLDTSTAMRITLDWAMRQSGANAGLVGILPAEDPSGILVMASQGYMRELENYQNDLLPSAAFQLQETIDSGLPLRRAFDGKGIARPVLETGKSQAILPIRREANTIGLLLLESTSEQPLSDEAMSFLTRLSDHASIAISNAQLYAAVQAANLAKSDFVSFVAHELKNPMTSVKGYTELIAAGAVGPINDAQSNFLGTIKHNIERMNTLVSDLNDSAKIEVGRLRLDFKAFSVPDVVDKVVLSMRRQIEEKQQTLIISVPKEMPQVWADRVRVEQVLVNLVSNAHKYTPAGGTLEVAAEECPNQWDPNGAKQVVHLWVKDNGIGITEEDQKKIFQKFFRSDDQKAREVSGTGLGLNITKSLAEMQGGRIWFESEFRKGTTFHFTVPVSEI